MEKVKKIFLLFLFVEKNYKNFEEICVVFEDGEIEGVFIDMYVVVDYKSEFFSDKIYVKQILDQLFGYGVVFLGVVVNVEQRCWDFINLYMSNIFYMIIILIKIFDVSEIYSCYFNILY